MAAFAELFAAARADGGLVELARLDGQAPPVPGARSMPPPHFSSSLSHVILEIANIYKG
jgi:hypothetical protein